MKDYRRFSRVPYARNVRCNNVTAWARDIGSGGMCLFSNQPLDTEKKLNLKLSLTSSLIIHTQAIVKWYRRINLDLFQYGFQFTDLNMQDLQLLQTYISDWHQKEIERRQFSRYSIGVQVKGSLSCNAELKNINSRGFCLILPEKLELNKILYFILIFPDMSEIQIYGQVIWCEQIFKKVYETGICFWHMDSGTENKINLKLKQFRPMACCE